MVNDAHGPDAVVTGAWRVVVAFAPPLMGVVKFRVARAGAGRYGLPSTAGRKLVLKSSHRRTPGTRIV